MKPIYLNLYKPKKKLGVGSSRFWGNPDLPKNVDYPMYVDEDGEEYPYFFICQINLEEIAPYDVENLLPHKGLLSFFAKIDYYIGCSDVYGDICGGISDNDAVKVLYFPDCSDVREVILVDDAGEQTSPGEMYICYSREIAPLSDEHSLFALPTHREWETWDPPFEDWEILLQVDSFSGDDFDLNFVDYGVLNLLISPEDLKNQCYDRVRAVVLST